MSAYLERQDQASWERVKLLAMGYGDPGEAAQSTTEPLAGAVGAAAARIAALEGALGALVAAADRGSCHTADPCALCAAVDAAKGLLP